MCVPTADHQANIAVQRQLTALGHQCELFVVPGTHAFHGLPPQWTLDWWRTNSYPATRKMLAFLTGGECELPEDTVPIPFDWSLPIVLLAHFALPLLLVHSLTQMWAE